MRRLALTLLILYALLTAYVNLTRPLGLPSAAPWTPFLTFLAFSFAVVHAVAALGVVRTTVLLAATFAVSLALETLGVATGLVYGPYHYTSRLGPMFLGKVPFLIPLAYFMMVYPSQVIAEGVLGGRLPEGWRRFLGLTVASALAVTAWDVLMDPLMVRLGFWEWEVQGAYFGVPPQNYVGWSATAILVYAVYRLADRWSGVRAPEANGRFMRLAAWSYAITWLGNSAAAAQLGLAGPVLAGAFSTGLVSLLGLAIVGRPTSATVAVDARA